MQMFEEERIRTNAAMKKCPMVQQEAIASLGPERPMLEVVHSKIRFYYGMMDLETSKEIRHEYQIRINLLKDILEESEEKL